MRCGNGCGASQRHEETAVPERGAAPTAERETRRRPRAARLRPRSTLTARGLRHRMRRPGRRPRPAVRCWTWDTRGSERITVARIGSRISPVSRNASLAFRAASCCPGGEGSPTSPARPPPASSSFAWLPSSGTGLLEHCPGRTSALRVLEWRVNSGRCWRPQLVAARSLLEHARAVVPPSTRDCAFGCFVDHVGAGTWRVRGGHAGAGQARERSVRDGASAGMASQLIDRRARTTTGDRPSQGRTRDPA